MNKNLILALHFSTLTKLPTAVQVFTLYKQTVKAEPCFFKPNHCYYSNSPLQLKHSTVPLLRILEVLAFCFLCNQKLIMYHFPSFNSNLRHALLLRLRTSIYNIKVKYHKKIMENCYHLLNRLYSSIK